MPTRQAAPEHLSKQQSPSGWAGTAAPAAPGPGPSWAATGIWGAKFTVNFLVNWGKGNAAGKWLVLGVEARHGRVLEQEGIDTVQPE